MTSNSPASPSLAAAPSKEGPVEWQPQSSQAAATYSNPLPTHQHNSPQHYADAAAPAYSDATYHPDPYAQPVQSAAPMFAPQAVRTDGIPAAIMPAAAYHGAIDPLQADQNFDPRAQVQAPRQPLIKILSNRAVLRPFLLGFLAGMALMLGIMIMLLGSGQNQGAGPDEAVRFDPAPTQGQADTVPESPQP